MIAVYTKKNCNWCVMVKKTLEAHEIPFTEYCVDDPLLLEQLKKEAPQVKTVPIIVVDNTVINGYNDLKVYLEKNNL